MPVANTSHARVVILGSGCAGLTAALYAARAGLAPILVEGLGNGGPPGGQLSLTAEVESYPGLSPSVLGPELMGAMRSQAEHFGTRLVQGDALRVALERRPFLIEGSGIDDFTLTCDSLILATGARPRKLGLAAEERLWGRGVSTCATCDAAFFTDEDVAVVGGGDVAFDEALYLARTCRSVTLLHRRTEFRAASVLVERVRCHPRMTVRAPVVIDDLLGDEKDQLRGVALRDVQTGTRGELAVRGVFLAIGHQPNSELFAGQLELDSHGYVHVGHGTATATSVAGVFAAGELADPVYRQAVTAAASGCKAALDCARWLARS